MKNNNVKLNENMNKLNNVESVGSLYSRIGSECAETTGGLGGGV